MRIDEIFDVPKSEQPAEQTTEAQVAKRSVDDAESKPEIRTNRQKREARRGYHDRDHFDGSYHEYHRRDADSDSSDESGSDEHYYGHRGHRGYNNGRGVSFFDFLSPDLS